jgi:hypothetical protein
MPLLRLALLGFIAGFLATLIFHQGLWFLFHQLGLFALPRPAWPLDPVPPFGVPSVLSKAFWGGVWGAGLAPVLSRCRGPVYWAGFILVGVVALTIVAFFVVAPLKGEPIPPLWPRFAAGLLLNGAWGFGTAALLRLFGGRAPDGDDITKIEREKAKAVFRKRFGRKPAKSRLAK